MREVAEAREERLLSQIFHQTARIQAELVCFVVQRASLMEERKAALQARTSAALLQEVEEHVHAIVLAEDNCREQLLKLERLRDTQMKLYEAAHCARQLLSDMRVTQHESFQKNLERQDQRAMDDSFGSHRLRK